MNWYQPLYAYWFIIVFQLYFIIIKYKENLFTPIIIFPLVVLFYIIYGNFALEYNKNTLGWYSNIDPTGGNNISHISLILMNTIFLLPISDNTKIKTNHTYSISLNNYDNSILYFGTFSIILNLIFYFIYVGDIPILRGNLNGYERFSIMKKVPSVIAKSINLASFCVLICLVRLFISPTKKMVTSFFLIINMIFAFGLGNRQPIVFPIINIFFFLILVKKISKFQGIVVGISIPIMGAIGALFRGDTKNVSNENLKFYLGGEYVDFLRMRYENVPLQYGKTLLSILYNIIPKQFYTLFELDKQDFSKYSAYIMMDVWGADTGQRVGIWGEFYINFGDVGIIIGFILMAILLRYLHTITLYKKNTKQIFLISYFYVLIIFSIIASWGTIGDDLGSYGLCYFLFTYLVFKKKKAVTLL